MVRGSADISVWIAVVVGTEGGEVCAGDGSETEELFQFV